MTIETDMNPPSSVDDGIHAILSDGKEQAFDCLDKWEACVRQHPVKAVLGAVVAGAVLHRLPVKSILVAKIKIVAALAPPALLAYGAAKLCEILQQKGETQPPRGVVDPDNPAGYV